MQNIQDQQSLSYNQSEQSSFNQSKLDQQALKKDILKGTFFGNQNTSQINLNLSKTSETWSQQYQKKIEEFLQVLTPQQFILFQSILQGRCKRYLPLKYSQMTIRESSKNKQELYTVNLCCVEMQDDINDIIFDNQNEKKQEHSNSCQLKTCIFFNKLFFSTGQFYLLILQSPQAFYWKKKAKQYEQKYEKQKQKRKHQVQFYKQKYEKYKAMTKQQVQIINQQRKTVSGIIKN